MKTIKFRVYDSISKKLYQWFDIKGIPIPGFDYEHYTIMQYVGFNDKNDIAIYEGDIISFTRNIGNYQTGNSRPFTSIHEVVWDEECCKFALKVNENNFQKLRNIPGYVYEILGNIYDNPTLLKEYQNGK